MDGRTHASYPAFKIAVTEWKTRMRLKSFGAWVSVCVCVCVCVRERERVRFVIINEVNSDSLPLRSHLALPEDA